MGMMYYFSLIVLVKVMFEQALEISFVKVHIQTTFKEQNKYWYTRFFIAFFGVAIDPKDKKLK